MAQYRVATFNPAIEQSIIKAGESIRKGFADRAEAERLNKERLRLEQEREIGKYTTQFDRLGKIDPTGNITYDTNMRNFFNTQVDNYVQIKNAMEAGDIDLNGGAQMLNQINGYIDQYKTLAPKIMGQVGYYKQLVKDGKLSNVNNSQMAHLLGKLAEGSSDISIEEINGQVYISDKNSNETGKSYDLSLNELEAILADSQASLVEEKLEAEDLGTDAAFELIDGIAGISQGVERSSTDAEGLTVQNKTFVNPDTVFELYKNQDEKDSNLGPFDDEETKAFYCDIPDFLTTIPPALLGYSTQEIERKQESNIQKYGSGFDGGNIDDNCGDFNEATSNDEFDDVENQELESVENNTDKGMYW